MKNKKLAIFLSIFVLFAVVIVLSSAIFSLNNVSLNFLNETTILLDQEQIIKSAGFKYGENVFFADKNAYINSLEKNNPYLKVINIETFFPNKFVINAVERTETYVFKMNNNKFVKTDENLKVLSVANVYQNTETNGILIENSNFENQDVSEGDFLKHNGFLTNLFTCFLEWGTDYTDVKSQIEEVELNYKNDENRIVISMRSGVQINVKDTNNQLSDKLNLAFSFYETTEVNGQPVDYKTSGIIHVYESDNMIKTTYGQVA